ncbi:MAG: DEAD/DEAH box helicase [Bacilli bacterium]|nr:DEAD/DEAH box helicase [Bacilli bacterium]
MTFKELGLAEPILKAILKEGYEEPSSIQEQAIPIILEGKDLLGCAQTGTGKTAAFALPLINNLINAPKKEGRREIQVLVLTPTRELAVQIRDNFRKFTVNTNLKCSVIFGGVNQRSQVEVLRTGVDILVATPGRLLDLIKQRHVKLHELKTLVLDEADTMLDMGFIFDVKQIIAKAPTERQTLLFSATTNKEVTVLAETLLNKHVTINVSPETMTVDKIKQSLYYIDKSNKLKLLTDILRKEDVKSALIFTRTKHGANKLSETLASSGISNDVIHGNKSQNARLFALNNFKNGKCNVLVATDIAARGIDVAELSHVINYEIPEKPEIYVHRIGRTGRAGFSGIALSFCANDEKRSIRDIEKLIKLNIPVVEDHDYPVEHSSEVSNRPNNRNRNRNNNYSKSNTNGNSNSNSGFKKPFKPSNYSKNGAYTGTKANYNPTFRRNKATNKNH